MMMMIRSVTGSKSMHLEWKGDVEQRKKYNIIRRYDKSNHDNNKYAKKEDGTKKRKHKQTQ